MYIYCGLAFWKKVDFHLFINTRLYSRLYGICYIFCCFWPFVMTLHKSCVDISCYIMAILVMECPVRGYTIINPDWTGGAG